jgi:hypothetical protein
MEGAREQQAEGAAPARHRGQDLRRAAPLRQLQAAQALRQQRSAQGRVRRGRLDRRGRRHHLPQGQCSYVPLWPQDANCCSTGTSDAFYFILFFLSRGLRGRRSIRAPRRALRTPATAPRSSRG